MSRHISLLPAGGAAPQWTQIATATPVGVSAAYFTAIPTGYNDLLVQLEEVSHNNGSSAQIQVALSADGITYSGTANASTTVSQSGTIYGAMYIPMYRANSGILLGSTANLFTSPGLSAINNNSAWRITGGITAICVQFSAGNFDAGTITLYGR